MAAIGSGGTVIALAAALVAVAASCTVPQAEAALQQSLVYDAFDSRSGPFGWRFLNESKCTDAALALLVAYAAANESRLTREQRLELAFHSGQVLAFAGRESEALPYFERATNAEATPEWHTYVAATTAFLKHDLPGLAAARDAYATLAPGSMRLRIVDGFVACPNKPYSAAAHCRM